MTFTASAKFQFHEDPIKTKFLCGVLSAMDVSIP